MKSFPSNATYEDEGVIRLPWAWVWFLAESPMKSSPSSGSYEDEGVIRLPCSLGMISTRPFLTPAHE
jgi:3-polyprenyl-4-hydroxybenzoate decarboxylase